MRSMNVAEFIRQEVANQGWHGSDAVLREQWMERAWHYAQSQQDRGFRYPLEVDLLHLGRLVEPLQNWNGFRRLNVEVGGRPCIDWHDVSARIGVLTRECSTMTPLDYYREFETIHPFVDGNGRIGKVLLAWLGWAGGFEDPEFPPNLFGGSAV